jgi:CRISPR-associated protein Csb2
MRAIENASPPHIRADPPDRVCRSSLVDRFVVADKTSAGNVQEYVARGATFTRPGERIAPREPTIAYTWPDVTLDAAQQRSIRERAARVGYLGASDAPVRVIPAFVEPLADGSSDSSGPADTGVDTDDRLWMERVEGVEKSVESTPVSVPYVGLLDHLDSRYSAFLDGASPPGATQHRRFRPYRVAGPFAPEQGRPARLWARFDRALPGGRIVAVAEAVKGLLLSEFGPDAPPILHGHGLPKGVDHVRFVPLPFVGRDHADGRLMGVMVQFPADADPGIVRRCNIALRKGTIYLGDARRELLPVLGPQAGRVPATARPTAWERSARRWSTATPVVWDRYSGGAAVADEVVDMCDRLGLPEPTLIAVERAPFITGGLDLKPWQTVRGGAKARPYAHVRLTFPKPILGPILMGRMRSFGLGLFWPDEPAPDQVSPNSASGIGPSAVGGRISARGGARTGGLPRG